jgi:hypothetical protein
MSRFRSTTLEPTVPGRTLPGLTLDVDALRRRDGLALEDELYRQERALRGVAPGDLDGFAARLGALEAALRFGRPVASYEGTTPAAVAPMITTHAAGIAALGNVTTTGIVYTFAEPLASARYCLAYTLQGTGANGVQHQLDTQTITGFVLRCKTGGGGTVNPQTTVWTFSFVVLALE